MPTFFYIFKRDQFLDLKVACLILWVHLSKASNDRGGVLSSLRRLHYCKPSKTGVMGIKQRTSGHTKYSRLIRTSFYFLGSSITGEMKIYVENKRRHRKLYGMYRLHFIFWGLVRTGLQVVWGQGDFLKPRVDLCRGVFQGL